MFRLYIYIYKYRYKTTVSSEKIAPFNKLSRSRCERDRHKVHFCVCVCAYTLNVTGSIPTCAVLKMKRVHIHTRI